MAVNNSIIKKEETKPTGTTFMAGNAEITLNAGVVRNFLASGNAEKITDQEVVMFIKLCQYQGLNPFLREAYIIKYGDQPATIVTGKSALEKRAARCEKFKGFEAGVIVLNVRGELEYRAGTLVLDNEQLVGGWASVYVQGFEKPVRAEVSLSEYIGRKKDGAVNSQWGAKPATMIRKVAKMQALREAFPENLQGMYSAEEMNVDELPETPVEVPISEAVNSTSGEIIDTASFAEIMEGEQ